MVIIIIIIIIPVLLTNLNALFPNLASLFSLYIIGDRIFTINDEKVWENKEALE